MIDAQGGPAGICPTPAQANHAVSNSKSGAGLIGVGTSRPHPYKLEDGASAYSMPELSRIETKGGEVQRIFNLPAARSRSKNKEDVGRPSLRASEAKCDQGSPEDGGDNGSAVERDYLLDLLKRERASEVIASRFSNEVIQRHSQFSDWL